MQASVLDVVAPGRRLDLPLVGAAAEPEAERREQDRSISGGSRSMPASRCQPRAPEAHGRGRRRHGPGDHRGTGVAAAQLEDQPRRELGRRQHQLRVEPALEAGAGIALDAEPAAGGRRAQRIEQRHLEHDVGRGVGDAGALAAHDAAEADRPGRVGDHGHAVVEAVGPAVQRLQLLAEPGEAQDEVALELGGVEHVQRPAEIEGQVVGDVDQGRDRPQADRLQPVAAARPGSARCARRG